MSSVSINIVSIVISNMLGITALLLLLLNTTWKLNGRDVESRMLIWIICIVMLMCIVDPITFMLDGRPGGFIHILLLFGNSTLFFCDMMMGPLWVAVLSCHMSGGVSALKRKVMNAICFVGTIILVINFFVPLVFKIDESNRYQRGPLYALFLAILAVFMLDAIGVYLYARRKGGRLKFFPMLQFIIPLIIGAVVQSMFYGISLIWPAGAVSMCGVLLSFQNEAVFRDELTGLFNRYYLDNLKKNATSMRKHKFTIVMMDLNDFKGINDRFGHAEGDRALRAMGEMMAQTVGHIGTAVRYAGDEFLFIVNSQEPDDVTSLMEHLNTQVASFNEKNEKDYKLDYSVGISQVDMKLQSLDDIMRDVDRKMYEDKKHYYEQNEKYERRRMM